MAASACASSKLSAIKIDLKTLGVRVCTGFRWLRIRSNGSNEHGNKSWGFIQSTELTGLLRNIQLLKENSVLSEVTPAVY